MALEALLGVKVGWGGNFAEADLAIKDATKLKIELNDATDNIESAITKVELSYKEGNEAISMYNGDPIKDNPDFKSKKVMTELKAQVKRTERDLKELEKTYGENSTAFQLYAARVQEESYDASTGALTAFGRVLKQTELEGKEIPDGMKRFTLLVDANNMHFWNDKIGYTNVDRHLYSIGASIITATRTSQQDLDTHERSADTQDLVSLIPNEFVTRTNGSTGDEFMVDLICREEDLMPISQRIVAQCYKDQLKLYSD